MNEVEIDNSESKLSTLDYGQLEFLVKRGWQRELRPANGEDMDRRPWLGVKPPVDKICEKDFYSIDEAFRLEKERQQNAR